MENSLVISDSSSHDYKGARTESKFKEGTWTSLTSYISMGLCYCMTPAIIGYFNQSKTEPATSQEIIMLLFVCLPVLYMQVSLGKYTQNSILNFQYMIPLTKGLGYMFLLNVAISAIKCVYLLTDVLLYFLLSFQLELPWSKCINTTVYKTNVVCYENKIPQNCSEVGKDCEIAARLFWTYIYMDTPEENSKPILQRFVSYWLSWLIVFALVNFSCMKKNRIFYLIEIQFLLFFLLMLIGVLFASGSSQGISLLFSLRTEYYVNITKWVKAVTKTTSILSLGQTFHIMSGSRMTTSTPAGVWCTILVIVIVFITMLAGIFTYGVLGIGEVYTGYKVSDYTDVSAYELAFVYVPAYLSYLNAPQCWCVTFFWATSCQLVLNATCRLLSILFSITNHVRYMIKYRGYLLAIFCAAGAIIGSFMLPGTSFKNTSLFLNETACIAELLTVTFQSIFVFWVYTVQTLGDDIHYVIGQQPRRFWKICWYMSPAIYSFATIHSLYSITYNSSKPLFQLVLIALISSPLFIFAIIQFFVYVKKRRLIDLLQPEVEWGVPDPEERHLRHSFNPRKEIRSKMRRYQCHHKCLIGNKVLRLANHLESEERKEAFDDNYIRVKHLPE